MSSLLEKLGSYHILTNLIPGAFFVFATQYLFGFALTAGNIGWDVVTYYFIGLIISRIASLVVMPLLRRK